MKNKNITARDKIKNEENIVFSNQQTLKNKKIYFDSDGTEIKIGYDEQTGVGFVEIISE
ncbi:MAG: hypothetical protein WCH65_01745 [bacterium]